MAAEAPWQLRDGNTVVAEWVNWKQRSVMTTGTVVETVDGAVVIDDGGRRVMIDLTRIVEAQVVTEGLDAKLVRREAMTALRGAADALKARDFDVGAFTRALSGVLRSFEVGH